MSASFLSAQHNPGHSQLGRPLQLSEAEVERYTQPASSELQTFSLDKPPEALSLESVPLSGFSIDRSRRNAVVAAYHRYYLASENYADVMNWTGNVASCDAGTIASAFRDKTLRRINYYRAQSGLSADIYFDATKNAKAQEAALIMAYENRLSHFPAVDFPGNPCLSPEGIDAAQHGNLALGSYGPGSIDRYMIDDGSFNTVVGHRRWLLYSQAQEMGSGSIPFNYIWPISLPEHNAANCVYVIGDFKAAPAPQPVAFPNDGYVPWLLSPDSGESHPRWSYSYPGADFSSATVTMTQGGSPVPVTQEPVATGYADNTLVWRPTGLPDAAPLADTTYTVHISGIKDAPFSTTTYDVTVIDPYTVNDPPVVSGPLTPSVNSPNTYSFSPTDQAEAYRVEIFESSTATWLEGAELSPAPQVIDQTDAAYDLISSSFAATGSRAFHLVTPSFTSEDSFTIDRTIYFRPGAEVSFRYRRFWMHPDTKLRVELSTDDGGSYTVIGSIDGPSSTGSSTEWDSGFKSASFTVPEGLQGTSARLRFRIEVTGSYYKGTTQYVGLYIDDIEVSQADALGAPTTQDLDGAATEFQFSPLATDQEYLIQVSPELGGYRFGAGSAFRVTSLSAPLPPVITSTATAKGAQGEAFSYLITATNAPSSFGASGLPTGADLNSSTGEIHGAIAPGNYSGITISATNSGGTGTAPLTIEILTGYAKYMQTNGVTLGLPEEDDDGDTIANIIEVGLADLDPTVPDAQHLPQAAMVGGAMVMTVQKSGVKGLDYAIYGTDDLFADPWTSAGLNILKDNETTLEVSVPLSHAAQYFLQLSVSQNGSTTLP